MNENAYSLACAAELEAIGMTYDRERVLPIVYRGVVLCYQRLDFLVAEQVVVEVKSVERLHPVHVAQVVSYLRLTGTRVGLIVNFNVDVLKQGIRRVIL